MTYLKGLRGQVVQNPPCDRYVTYLYCIFVNVMSHSQCSDIRPPQTASLRFSAHSSTRLTSYEPLGRRGSVPDTAFVFETTSADLLRAIAATRAPCISYRPIYVPLSGLREVWVISQLPPLPYKIKDHTIMTTTASTTPSGEDSIISGR